MNSSVIDDKVNSLLVDTGTTSHIVTDENGHVTMPSQSSFMAHPASVQSNISASTWTDIAFGTERYDVNGDFASNTFTAPVTGKYVLSYQLNLRQVPNDATALYWTILTSNCTYYNVEDTTDTLSDTGASLTFGASIIADMDANDTAKVVVYQSAGGAVTDLDNGYFSGYLVC